MNNIKIIVIHDQNRGIGYKNTLPWHISEDLKLFSKLTKGNGNNAIIMGKNTWNSLPNKKPLPMRDNLILSAKEDINIKHDSYIAKSFTGMDELLYFCKEKLYDNMWIIGGEQIYNLFINLASECHSTILNETYDTDTYFPMLPDNWKLSESVEFKYGIKNTYINLNNVP